MSCDTEDLINDAENSALHYRNKLNVIIYKNRKLFEIVIIFRNNNLLVIYIEIIFLFCNND